MQKYSDAELEAMIVSLESERVERKRTLNKDTSIKIREAICAFANDFAHTCNVR